MQEISHNGKRYYKVTPVKALFKSTMVHDVITRGDIFAVDIETGDLTILPRESISVRPPTKAELARFKELRDSFFL